MTKAQITSRKDISRWNGIMKNIPCFLLGNGPSIKDFDMSILDNYFTIGINRIFYAYDPTVLIWQDLALWVQEKNEINKTKAIKVCRKGAGGNDSFYTFNLSGRDSRLTDNILTLYGRGSSGSITYQFAKGLGCNPIVLVGMDCCYRKVDDKEITDFYGRNPMHKPHTLVNCVKGLHFIKNNSNGVDIYNCSESSVFDKKYTIEEVISLLPDKKYNREELEKMIIEK